MKKKKRNRKVSESDRRLTGDILTVVNTTVYGAKSATSNNTLYYELGGVNLPFLSLPSGGGLKSGCNGGGCGGVAGEGIKAL